MCGIAGVLGRLSDRNRGVLQRMKSAIAHRGPDGDGSWESMPDARGAGVMLGFRRLAILDLSTAGMQPMVDSVTGDVVVFNGEIYNYAEIRGRLAAQGQLFQSSGDTAVMLRALSLQGREAIGGFRGMFAFAFWNSSARQLTLARDPLGMKPLYFAQNPDPEGEWSLVFASELRAILASGLLGRPRLDPHAAASVVWNGFMISPDTAIAGVQSVWPGQVRVFDGALKQGLPEFHWRLPDAGEQRMDEKELAQALAECVRIHLASDVPLGVFLSGGIDSSAIANLAHRSSPGQVSTFTLAFDERDHDESPFARSIAQAIGTHHREMVLTEQHFIDQLDAALDSLDQPSFDGLNSFYMSQAVREAGFKVALVGTGGDELFGGYTTFRDLPAFMQWHARLRWIPRPVQTQAARMLASVIQPQRGVVPQQSRWAKLPEMVAHGGDMLALYQLAYALFLPDFQRELLGDSGHSAPADGLTPAMRERLEDETRRRSPLATISVLEQRIFLGERLLRDTDAASMAASIELRLPLVDSVLLESVMRVPDDKRYLPLRRKAMLRRIGLVGLDPTLFDRPKAGFVLPFDRWLKTKLGKSVDKVMRDPVAIRPTGLDPAVVGRLWQAYLNGTPGIYWTRVWALYVFVRWCQRYDVSV